MSLFKSRSGALFGQNIPVSCEYCANAVQEQCSLKKEIKKGRCAAFEYDPLLRRPKTTPPLPALDPEEFKL